MNNSVFKTLPAKAPLLTLATVLMFSSAFATEPAEEQAPAAKTSEKHVEVVLSASEEGPEKAIKIVVLGSDDGEIETGRTALDTGDYASGDEKDGVLISLESSEDGIASIKDIVKTLAMTQWHDLSEEEKEQLLDSLENLDAEMTFEVHPDIDMSSNSSGEGIIAIIAVFGLPLFLLIAILFYKHRKRMVKVALVKDYLDAGKDVPAEVLTAINGAEPDAPANSFQSGVRNIAMGAGLFLFLGLLIDWGLAAVALIPLFIGIGKLIVWHINKDSTDNQAS